MYTPIQVINIGVCLLSDIQAIGFLPCLMNSSLSASASRACTVLFSSSASCLSCRETAGSKCPPISFVCIRLGGVGLLVSTAATCCAGASWVVVLLPLASCNAADRLG